MPGTYRYSATFDTTYLEELPPSANPRVVVQSWEASQPNAPTSPSNGQSHNGGGHHARTSSAESLDSYGGSSGGSASTGHSRQVSTDGGTDFIPTRKIVQSAAKPAHNPLQFVKIGQCSLYKQAAEQIKLAKEVKISKEVLKEDEEEWQTNLDCWKSKRRQKSEKCIQRAEERRQIEVDEQNITQQRKTKTFSQMMEQRAGRPRSYNLSIYTDQPEYQDGDASTAKEECLSDSSNSGIQSSTEREETDPEMTMGEKQEDGIELTLKLRLRSSMECRDFGFTLRGGKEQGMSVFVDTVVPHGVGDLAGLRPGDEILGVNGEASAGRSRAAVVFAVKQAMYMGQMELDIWRPACRGMKMTKYENESEFSGKYDDESEEFFIPMEPDQSEASGNGLLAPEDLEREFGDNGVESHSDVSSPSALMTEAREQLRFLVDEDEEPQSTKLSGHGLVQFKKPPPVPAKPKSLKLKARPVGNTCGYQTSPLTCNPVQSPNLTSELVNVPWQSTHDSVPLVKNSVDRLDALLLDSSRSPVHPCPSDVPCSETDTSETFKSKCQDSEGESYSKTLSLHQPISPQSSPLSDDERQTDELHMQCDDLSPNTGLYIVYDSRKDSTLHFRREIPVTSGSICNRTDSNEDTAPESMHRDSVEMSGADISGANTAASEDNPVPSENDQTDLVPADTVAEQMEQLILEQLEMEETEWGKAISKLDGLPPCVSNDVSSEVANLDMPPRCVEPPKEKPPPPPEEVDSADQKGKNFARANSTKRIKKELWRRRSDFLGLESPEGAFVDGDLTHPSIAPRLVSKPMKTTERRTSLPLENEVVRRSRPEEDEEIFRKEREIIENLEREERERHEQEIEKEEQELIIDEKDSAPESEEDERISRLKEERRRMEEERSLREEQRIRMEEERQLREREELIRCQEEALLREREKLRQEQEALQREKETYMQQLHQSRHEEHRERLQSDRPSPDDETDLQTASVTRSFPQVVPQPTRHRSEDPVAQRPSPVVEAPLGVPDTKDEINQASRHLQGSNSTSGKETIPVEDVASSSVQQRNDRTGHALAVTPPNFPMPRQSLHSLGVTPKAKIIQNEQWIRQHDKVPVTKRRSDSTPREGRYNQNHWLVQEAEMRRIAEQKERQRRQTSPEKKPFLQGRWSVPSYVSPEATNGIGLPESASSGRLGRASTVGGPPVPPPKPARLARRTTPFDLPWNNYSQSYPPASRPGSYGPPSAPSRSCSQYAGQPAYDTIQQPAGLRLQRDGMEPQEQMLSVSGRKRCSDCGKELGRGAAMIIESLQLYYHIHCFCCCVCQVQLGNGSCGTDVRVRNNKLHCQNCYSNDEAGLKFSQV